MILIFKDTIINMDNVAFIERTGGLKNSENDIIISTNVTYGEDGSRKNHDYEPFSLRFTIKKTQWHELIRAIQEKREVFFFEDI